MVALQQVEESSLQESQAQALKNSALASGMQEVARALCDTIVQLQDDFNVWGLDRVRDSFFGRSMAGESFLSFVSARDQQRFRSLLGHLSASRVPQAMALTLERHNGGPVEAQILVVDTDCEEPRFLVGVLVDWSLTGR